LEAGRSINQETRLWDSNRKESRALRSKEEAHDYRYFPDPDLLPLTLAPEEVENVKANLPELPLEKLARYQEQLGLGAYDAGVLTVEKEVATYFENALALHSNAKSLANWIINEMQLEPKIKPAQLAELVKLIDDRVISGTIAKTVYEALLTQPSAAPTQIVESRGLKMQRDTGALQAIIESVCNNNAAEVEKFKSGKQQVFGFLMGQVMKQSAGKADPVEATALLKKYLGT
jgi:aspartyl-tRNA(Asn)/glutamyl-tRNA(Gln) amidotransferase subunit B